VPMVCRHQAALPVGVVELPVSGRGQREDKETGEDARPLFVADFVRKDN
jgi:hypothetical protein